MRERLGRPPTVALTATATGDVREDIIRRLQLHEPNVVVTGFDRPNLTYESRRTPKVSEKDAELLNLCRSESGSGIVYCATRKAVEEVATMLGEQLRDGRVVVTYHAGLEPTKRSAHQEQFMQSPRAIAVATNAFGMGINKPDTRFVIHYNVPGTLEAYYQEAGRAGRDGQPARCVMLFSYQDRFTHEYFINKIGEQHDSATPAEIEQMKRHATEKLDLVLKYAQSHRCRRRMILDYFGDDADVDNCNCDICQRQRGGAAPVAGPVVNESVTTLTRQLLSAIARLHGKFGVGVVAEVLVGSDSERTQRWGLTTLSTFGLLKTHSSKRIIAMLHRLMEAGLARQRDPDGVKFRPVIELTAAGVEVMKGTVPPAHHAGRPGAEHDEPAGVGRPPAPVAGSPIRRCRRGTGRPWRRPLDSRNFAPPARSWPASSRCRRTSSATTPR